MRRRLLTATCLLTALSTAAGAETPAERASDTLRDGVARDRAAEAGGPEGPRPAGTTPVTRALDADRRSIQPDVGRPETEGGGVTGGERAADGAGQSPQR